MFFCCEGAKGEGFSRKGAKARKDHNISSFRLRGNFF
jgi:hypothetical protein